MLNLVETPITVEKANEAQVVANFGYEIASWYFDRAADVAPAYVDEIIAEFRKNNPDAATHQFVDAVSYAAELFQDAVLGLERLASCVGYAARQFKTQA